MEELPNEEIATESESTKETVQEAVQELLAENDEPKWYDSESVEHVFDDVKDIPIEKGIEEK